MAFQSAHRAETQLTSRVIGVGSGVGGLKFIVGGTLSFEGIWFSLSLSPTSYSSDMASPPTVGMILTSGWNRGFRHLKTSGVGGAQRCGFSEGGIIGWLNLRFDVGIGSGVRINEGVIGGGFGGLTGSGGELSLKSSGFRGKAGDEASGVIDVGTWISISIGLSSETVDEAEGEGIRVL
ncbi:hypothetical protein Moror_14876 [Moniliophthora roreri MCA 2997]|uniref:Uncharacterized protein n=1 Tax=Moniliophthora roreri (strain MCA 2997) TaxID=1381753 RepID=V2WKX5_MONRO|nr:hypothetical protein Moror_14876 [Moniliophthora roreri MCA 2997]